MLGRDGIFWPSCNFADGVEREPPRRPGLFSADAAAGVALGRCAVGDVARETGSMTLAAADNESDENPAISLT